ncbi:MAG: pilus assembly PilX N-terminal domain-containing protein [Rubrivivax sp.]|nr:pilus assembly PilX N-terminal domain-containing protein [Rubrivivax sp.]
MVLFFIITLVAAYTSRNLLFEQRTSTNQYRATLAFEAAEAGIEWAIARLNEGRMNDDCTELAPATAVATPPQPSFRERYLSTDAASGVITSLPLDQTQPRKLAGCVFNGADWVCHCPDSGEPAPTVTTTGNGPFPAFWVRLLSSQIGTPPRPGVVRIQVNACTRADPACLRFDREAQSGDGLASVWTMVALRSALVSAPAAAVTVRGTFDPGTNAPVVTNDDTNSGGITIHAGGAVGTAGIVLTSVPGSPASLSIRQNDPSLALPDLVITPATPASSGDNRMFNSVFGTWPAVYQAQPGVAVVTCGGGCTAAEVNAVVDRQPGHAIHVSGGGTLVVGAAIGTATAPVMILADGDVEFDGTAPTVHGVVYSRGGVDQNWQLQGGNGTIRGAAIAERAFTFAGANPTIHYDRDVILRLRNLNGSFAKVAGSWRDFQSTATP